MGLPRLTGISTPLIGLNWEYRDELGGSALRRLRVDFDVDRKINVFISSKCDRKYKRVRKKLYEKLKNTNLFEVHSFEEKGASSLSAKDSYELEELVCDVVIFLIDNKDGIPEGVHNEIEIAKKYSIKSLFYFCTEHSKEQTIVQKQQTGPESSKYKEVEKFDDLAEQGFHDLVSDILNIYHYYCQGQLGRFQEEGEENQTSILIEEPDSYIPKAVLRNLPKTREKLLQEAIGKTYHNHFRNDAESSRLDEIALQLLQVMFNNVKIDSLKKDELLDELKEQGYSEKLLSNVDLRLCAVEEYFKGNLDSCIDRIDEALIQAKEEKLPVWLQHDILIDLRNMKLERTVLSNARKNENEAQEELSASNEVVFYPVLDRLRTDFHKTCIEELFKEDIKSPYTMTFDNNLSKLGDGLAGAFVVAMSHGSLTHLLITYHDMELFTYYLSCRYSDWSIQRNLFKFAIFNGKEKDVEGLIRKYPKLQIQMSAMDASIIMNFTDNHPLRHKKLKSYLLGVGAVGYFLSDTDFPKWSSIVFGHIYTWLETKEAWMSVGNLILKSIEKVQYRVPQESLVSLISEYLKKRYRYWYRELFSFIDKSVDLKKLKPETSEQLVSLICDVVKEEFENGNPNINDVMFLATLRKQDKQATERLDCIVKEKLPTFYRNEYMLETSDDEQKDMPVFIEKYLKSISDDNKTQGVDGHYVGKFEQKHRIIRNILDLGDYNPSNSILSKIILVASETFLQSNESISVKTDAVELLIFIALKYNGIVTQNEKSFAKLLEADFSDIQNWDNTDFFSNLEVDVLEIAFHLLLCILGGSEYISMLTLITKATMNKATEIRVSLLLSNYLEWADKSSMDQQLTSLIAVYALSKLKDESLDIRWNMTNAILNLSDVEGYAELVNRQIVDLIDSDNHYIKNLLQRNVSKHPGIDIATRNYIVEKCRNDNNFVVRYVVDKYSVKNATV